MNRRLFLSLGVLTFAAVAVYIGSTSALFTASAQSQDHVFTSGGVSILMSDIEHNYNKDPDADDPTGFNYAGGSFAFGDLKPLDWGELLFTIANGNNEAYVCGYIDGEVPEENPNLALYENLQFYAGSNQMLFGQWVDLGTVAANGSTEYGVDYCFGVPTVTSSGIVHCAHGGIDYNPAQNGQFEADIYLFAIQARNNEGFTCDSLTFNGGDVQVNYDHLPDAPGEVGADLGLYTAPDIASCDAVVDGVGTDSGTFETVAEALGDGDFEAGDTVCVEDITIGTTVVLGQPVKLLSLTGANNTATLANGVHVQASGVTVSGFVVNPGAILGEQAAFYLNAGINDVEISSNIIDGLAVGATRGVLTQINGAYGPVLVYNNVIRNLTTGVSLNSITGTPLQIRYNDIHDNVAGVAGFTNAYVEYNEFSSNSDEGVGVDDSHNGVGGIHFNNFLGGDTVITYAPWPTPGDITNTVNAINNFWNIDGATQAQGDVNFVPEAPLQYPHR